MFIIQNFREKDKEWFRDFADQHNITFKELTTEISPIQIQEHWKNFGRKGMRHKVLMLTH